MGYRERFNAYKEGKLKEDERTAVENDIERQQVIAEYMDTGLDAELFEDKGSADSPEDEELSRFVKKAVGKKLRKYSICAGAIILAIVLFLLFGLSPLMDAMYYNPGQRIDESIYSYNIVDLPLAVYTELHGPGIEYVKSKAEPKGYGKYNITVWVNRMRAGLEVETYDFTMERGRFTDFRRQWLNNYPLIIFTRSALNDKYESAYKSGEDESELKKLPDTAMAAACLTFSDDLDISEVKNMDSDDKQITYLPIRASDDDSTMDTLIYYGFAPEKRVPVFAEDYYGEDIYPFINLVNWNEKSGCSAKAWEIHFKSMLKYMADNKEFDDAFGLDADKYSNALDYVEKNGVKAFGMIVTAPVGEILKFYEDERIESVMILDVKLSKFSM